MNRLTLVASAAAVLVAGCGGTPPTAQPGPGPTGPAASSAVRPLPSSPSSTDRERSSATGTLVVDQKGTTPARTLWFLRVEDLQAKAVLERGYPGQALALRQTFPTGRYRVIVWHRRCADTCPVSGEAGLGPLEQVCGTEVRLVAGVRASTTAVVNADGSCSLEVTG